jgi:uncharacterized protein (TIGR03437 family)
VTFTLQSRVPGPAVTADSFRNYATGQPGLAPGNLVLLTGAGIAKNVTDLAVANIFFGRLPQDFRGLVVEFRSQGNSYYAPIYWIAREGQTETALIQVPYEISGPAVDVIVRVDGVGTTVSNVPVSPVSPGIIEDMIDGRRAAIVVRSDGLVATKAVPARRGETVRLYAIGLGQTQPKAETNRLGQADQLVVGRVAVGIDNAGVEVIRAKMAENLIGIYEVIFKIPEDAQLGDRPLGLIVTAPGWQRHSTLKAASFPLGPRNSGARITRLAKNAAAPLRGGGVFRQSVANTQADNRRFRAGSGAARSAAGASGRATGARGGNRPRRQGPVVCQAQSECRSGAASWRRSGVHEPQVWRHRRHPHRVARCLPGCWC